MNCKILIDWEFELGVLFSVISQFVPAMSVATTQAFTDAKVPAILCSSVVSLVFFFY